MNRSRLFAGRTSAIRLAATIGAVLATATVSLPAAAQRSGDGEVQRLIDQLNPTGRTRGIRLPSESPAPPPASPAPAAPRERVAAPMAKPVAPPPRTTTAPPDVAAASITVLFVTGSATLTPQAERSLDALGQALSSQQLAPYRFRIEGHTDTVGSRELNQALSEQRAAAVRAYLIQRFGVPPERLESVGLGEDQLLVMTPDQTPERRNRRVQIVNLGS